jgi:hypothetical protein
MKLSPGINRPTKIRITRIPLIVLKKGNMDMGENLIAGIT